ncbi:hypothetical protein BKA62DRAFT_694569 [Auriculariales sp. MPI-PUGE-AT-0066]|nr:hypothetical protein BKA62DRAFT_694569 [Auriculariales sp. MPI-PUGE-AT-0066]
MRAFTPPLCLSPPPPAPQRLPLPHVRLEMWCSSVLRLVVMALSLAVSSTLAMRLYTPEKWNVNVANVMMWWPESGDPVLFDAYLKHPKYLKGEGLIIVSSGEMILSGMYVWIPRLWKSDQYSLHIVDSLEPNRTITNSKRFLIVDDDSPAIHYSYTFTYPQNLSPSETGQSGSSTTGSANDAPGPATTTTERSSHPSLSYNASRRRRKPCRLISAVALSSIWLLAAAA